MPSTLGLCNTKHKGLVLLTQGLLEMQWLWWGCGLGNVPLSTSPVSCPPNCQRVASAVCPWRGPLQELNITSERGVAALMMWGQVVALEPPGPGQAWTEALVWLEDGGCVRAGRVSRKQARAEEVREVVQRVAADPRRCPRMSLFERLLQALQ